MNCKRIVLHRNATKKQWALFLTGLIFIITGLSICSFFGIRKIYRELQKQKLLRENVVVEIADLDIKAPVLEGTEAPVLSKGAGHFIGTGQVGTGNYCIAAHSSTLYKEYFNNLKYVKIGMEILLYNTDKQCYTYKTTKVFVVDPTENWILQDFHDNRVTLVTCTDDGSKRLVVIGTLN